eukprot:3326259-Prymnesium_polylepis.1
MGGRTVNKRSNLRGPAAQTTYATNVAVASRHNVSSSDVVLSIAGASITVTTMVKTNSLAVAVGVEDRLTVTIVQSKSTGMFMGFHVTGTPQERLIVPPPTMPPPQAPPAPQPEPPSAIVLPSPA